VFPVKYELNSYIICCGNSALKGLTSVKHRTIFRLSITWQITTGVQLSEFILRAWETSIPARYADGCDFGQSLKKNDEILSLSH
jgi:hypothetical protein